MTVPVLVCRDARVEAEGGGVLLEGVTCEADGARVGLVGAWSALFGLFSGTATLRRGTIDVLGEDARTVLARRKLGIARLDADLPETWTSTEYLAMNGRLVGLGRRAATRAARQTLEALELGALGGRKIHLLDRGERRALSLANAALGAPPVVAVERPLAGLGDSEAIAIRQILARVGLGRRLLVSIDASTAQPREREFVASMDHLVVLASGTVVAAGPTESVMTSSPRCVVWASHAAEPLVLMLRERGVQVEPVDGAPFEGDAGGRFVVLLDDGITPMTIVESAHAVGAPLLELLPIGLSAAGS
jgi:ABC-type multidrug transport system ATPase subunit